MKEQLVFPGFSVKSLIESDSENQNVLLGPGIQREGSLDIIAIKCGRIRRKVLPNGVIYWIDSQQKRYVAVKGERVIGIVVSKKGQTLDIDIGTSDNATLNNKVAKLDAKTGDVIYAQIFSANKDIRPELVVATPRGKKDGLGLLPTGGIVINAPLHVCRRILSPDCRICDELGERIKYEIAIGFNGRIWIKSASVAGTIYVCDIIQKFCEEFTSTVPESSRNNDNKKE